MHSVVTTCFCGKNRKKSVKTQLNLEMVQKQSNQDVFKCATSKTKLNSFEKKSFKKKELGKFVEVDIGQIRRESSNMRCIEHHFSKKKHVLCAKSKRKQNLIFSEKKFKKKFLDRTNFVEVNDGKLGEKVRTCVALSNISEVKKMLRKNPKKRSNQSKN